MKSALTAVIACTLAASAGAETMSIVSMKDPSFCLDLLGERTQDNTPIDVWKCTPGLLGQQWYFDAGSYKIRSAIDGSKCMDASTNNSASLGVLHLRPCSNTSKFQNFGWDDATHAIYYTPEKSPKMVNGSLCIVATDLKQGGAAAVVNCGTVKDASSKWKAIVGPPPSPHPNATFTFSPGANATLCIGLDGNKTDNGAPVLVSNCSGGKDQEWIFAQGTYQIQSALNTGKCIDAWSMKKGNQLMLWDCNGFPQQQWGYKQTSGKSTGTVYLSQAKDNQECLDTQFQGAKGVAVVGQCSEWQLRQAKPMVMMI